MEMVSQTPEVNFKVTFPTDIPHVHIPARLSVLEAVAFKATCQQLITLNPVPPKIILDFNQTTFIDSSGVGALVSNLKTAKQKEIELILQNVGSQVMAVFSLTSLDQVLTIENKIEQTPSKNCNKSININQLPVTHPSVKSWVKRALDLVGAIVGLTITGVLSIPIVIAIRLDSPGPIFFGTGRVRRA